MSSFSQSGREDESAVVNTTISKNNLTLKDKAGDAANRWLAKNRSLVLRQTPVWAQSLTALLISLGTIAVVGGILFRIDEVVTVQGQLKSIGGTIDVETPAGGLISDVFFEDGEIVEKGQLLLRFDTRRAASEKQLLTNQIEFEKQQLATQLKTLESQVQTLNGRESVLDQRLKTKKLMLNELASLVAAGGFQKLQFLQQQDQYFALQKQKNENQEQKNRIQLESDRLILQSRQSIDRLKSDLKKSELQLQYQNVLSPASGIVFDPKARVDGVLGGGERILSIVPQKGLYAEVFVPNKDIGFIKLQQKAKVRVDAFPFTRYGEISARVSQIAADALPPTPTQDFYRFPVKLLLEKSTLETQGISIPLKSGMAITTNLKLRDKRVISLISDVFVDQTDSIRSLRQQ